MDRVLWVDAPLFLCDLQHLDRWDSSLVGYIQRSLVEPSLGQNEFYVRSFECQLRLDNL